MDVEKYRRLFVEEASEHVAEMSGALTSLESRDGGSAEGAIDTLFRMAHSIKGMAASLEYESVAVLAHRLEDWLEPLRETGAVPDGALEMLYQVVGAFEEMVQAVEESGEAPETRGDLIERLANPPASEESAREDPPSKKARSSKRRRSRAPFACAPRRSIGSWQRWES